MAASPQVSAEIAQLYAAEGPALDAPKHGTLRVYLVRHGESANNCLARQGSPETYQQRRSADPLLSDIGAQQADCAGKYLSKLPITRFYCSAMRRALHTARVIAQSLPLTPHVWVDLHEAGGIYKEIDGVKQGMTGMGRAEIQEEFPTFILEEEVAKEGWWKSGFEDSDAVFARATKIFDYFRSLAREGAAPQAKQEQIALVSHGDFLNAFMRTALGIPAATSVSFKHFNCGITCLDFVPLETGQVKVEAKFINNSSHLPPDITN